MKCEKKKSGGKRFVFRLLQLMLIWCAAVSVYKTQEANAAAKKRREAREQSAQEWEFDRVYPDALKDL